MTQAGEERADRPGDVADRVLDRAEHGVRDPPQRAAAAGAVVERDQRERGKEEHREYDAGPPRVAHAALASRAAQWRGSEMRTCCRASNSSTHLPAPMATELSGLSVMWIGMPVSCFNRSSRPRSIAPPPVSTMPRSMTSPESSGGVLSRVVLTASTIWLTGSSIALRISSELTTMVFGR